MLSPLISISFFWLIGKMIWFGIKATWGVFKILARVFFIPAIIAILFYTGLVYLAIITLVLCVVDGLITDINAVDFLLDYNST